MKGNKKKKKYFSRTKMSKPLASKVLKSYLHQKNYPHWTSFFIKYSSVSDDNHGKSHFNFNTNGQNYEILRTGCYPFIKYHCTKQNPPNNLIFSDKFITFLKFCNLFLPCLIYGGYAWFLVGYVEKVVEFDVKLYFLIKEEENSRF